MNRFGLGERGIPQPLVDHDQRSLYRIQKGARSQSIVSKSSPYTLVMFSDKPEAKAFQDWAAISKDATYAIASGGTQ